MPLRRGDRQFEAFELVREPRMEPDSAGAVHRIRDDQQRPRKPLRHIGTCGHRDTGAGIDDDATGPAYRAQQPFELGLGEVGDLGRVLQRERRDRGSERVDVLDRCVDAIAQHFTHQSASTA